MADFEKAFEITMGHEGAYSFDMDDAGGETYMGISRKYNPSWEGWKLIDTVSDKKMIQIECPSVMNHVRSYYKKMYWDRFLGDSIDNQAIANEMFDTAVNMGVARAAMFLQKGLNYLNRNESTFKDLVVDGFVGEFTLRMLFMLDIDDQEVLFKIMNVLQGQHYLEYMNKSPIQEKYCRGWFKRIEITKGA